MQEFALCMKGGLCIWMEICSFYIYSYTLFMSRTRTEIQDCLFSIILFIKAYKTFEIGELARICQLLQEENSLYEQKNLSRMLIHFISHIFEQSKKSHSQYQYLSLTICESLIYNLYRNNSKYGMNNSIYSNSINISSSSQIAIQDQSTHSIRNYDNNDDNIFTTFLQDFITDDQLFKKIKQMIDRNGRKINGDAVNKCQRCADVMIQTVEYMLNKDGKNQKGKELQNFKEIVGSKTTGITSHYEKKNMKKVIGEVNKIIFSNKINRIVFLLEQAKQNTFLSLLRIYFSCSIDDKQRDNIRSLRYFGGVNISGDQMMLNLIWTYIESIPNKAQLFETPKNPLFKLIESYLCCFFVPTFRKFNTIVGKCCKYDFSDSIEFYQACETTINKDLCEFIEELPQDLLDYLRQIYDISFICQLKTTKKQGIQTLSTTVLSRVKKLLVYSLLAKLTLIQVYYSQGIDLAKYEQVCSYLINLFFKSSLKKYGQLPQKQNMLITTLTKCISKKLDDKIIGTHHQDADLMLLQRNSDIHSYILEQPIINNDYEVLWEVIRNIEFTPKDLKEFQMHTKTELADKIVGKNQIENRSNYLGIGSNDQIFSPMHRAKKEPLDINESIQYFDSEENQYQKEDVDFLTWMSVGGSCDYGSRKPFRNRSITTEKLKQLSKVKVFTTKKIRQIENLYKQYEDLIN